MASHLNDEMKDEDSFTLSNSFVPYRSNENTQDKLIDKLDNEKTQLFSCDAYWDCTDIKLTADAVFAVSKLSYDFIDKIMLCAIKLSSSKNIDHKLTIDNVLSVLENDDRMHKRAQDVIRSHRRHSELLFAFEDSEYIKFLNRDTIRN